jgi:hypothetical protein
MTSVAHNGFGCPYCRTAMAEEVHEESSDDGEEEEEEMFDDDALRGFRFFFNNLDGEAHDGDDEAEENEMDEEETEEDEEPDVNVPTTNFVAQRLRDQGVTFEQLVRLVCNIDHEEYSCDEQAERFGDELFGKIRIIVSNYQPQQAAPVVVHEHHHTPGSVIPEGVVVIRAVPDSVC